MIQINEYKCICGNKDPSKFFEDSERGELVCQGCGLVSQLNVEHIPVSASSELLGSIIDPSFVNKSEGEFNGALRRIAKRDSSNYTETRWRHLVDELSVRIGIPEQVSESVIQYHSIHLKQLPRMRRRELAVALLYVHARNYLKQHRSLKEISREVGANLNVARRYVMQLGFENGLKPAYRPPEEYVPVFGSRLNVDRGVIELGAMLARSYRESAFSCSAPSTIAACALYLACRENGHRYTQKEIANVSGIAEYTVREITAKMRDFSRLHHG